MQPMAFMSSESQELYKIIEKNNQHTTSENYSHEHHPIQQMVKYRIFKGEKRSKRGIQSLQEQ